MATLLEIQELFRNISDPDVEELLRTSPKETRWMVMDEKRRRGEMRRAEKAAKAESQIKPRNMLEEYQANTSNVLGGQPLGDIGQQGQGQYGEMESSGSPDPYADQQGGVQEYAIGGAVIPAIGALGRTAAASSIPWIAKLAQRLGARPAAQATATARRAAPLPPGWTIGPHGLPMPPRGGVPGPSGRLSPPHPGDPAITTPMGQIPGRGVNLPQGRGAGAGRPAASPAAATGGATDTAEEAVKKGFIRRHPYLTGGAAALGLGYMMDDDVDEAVPLNELGAPVAQGGPQGTSQYMDLLQRIMDRDDELQERVGDARISREDKIRRVGLAASAAMMSTPGGFGRGLGAAFGAAGQELGAISQEEDAMLRNAVYEYQVGSGSSTDLIRAIAAINTSMNSGGRGGMTETMLIKLLQEYGLPNIPEFLNDLNRARAMVSGQGQVAQTDYDHSTLGSAYGTD